MRGADVSQRIESETDLIETYLAPLTKGLPGAFGLKDDAALLSVASTLDLVVTTDPIIAGVHFFADDRPEDIAWKALAVNVSDLAAKGADPAAYVMTLALPQAPNPSWMRGFAAGLGEAQRAFGCHLAGGDTDRTPGPLAIGVTAIGTVPKGAFVRRQSATAGDHVFVTGTLGDAALGLALRRDRSRFGAALGDGDHDFLIARYLRPEPRLALKDVLRQHASAALDISDGFLKDLTHLAGGCGFDVPLSSLPLSEAARRALVAATVDVTDAVLAGGGDYELLVAVPSRDVAAFAEGARLVGIAVTDIGALRPQVPVRVMDDTGTAIEVARSGYDHFSRSSS